MRVLFLGNSFTYYHDLPVMAGKLLSCATESITRGGAYLHDFLNAGDELNALMEAALKNGGWDYVVLQEQSFNAVGNPEDFLKSVKGLCEKIRASGARSALYCSWAYQEGGRFLRESGLSYQQMMEGLLASYSRAAQENEALLAPVGPAFAALQGDYPLYDPDTLHPSLHGSYLAACVICHALAPKAAFPPWAPEGIDSAAAMKIQSRIKEN